MSKRLAKIVATLGLLAFSLLFANVPSEALATNELEIFYLDSNGAVVGYFFRGCSGGRIVWGITTDSKLSYSASCTNTTYTIGCMWSGGYSSCAANMFWDLCTDHYGPETCSL